MKKDKNVKKIATLLERISQVFRSLLWDTAKKKNLTPLQVQILNFLQNRKRTECVQSKMAEEFELTKATLSEAVKTLVNKGLVKKHSKASKDKRFSFLLLTPLGARLARELSAPEKIFEKYIQQFNVLVQMNLLVFLLNLTRMLYADGLITVAKNCCTCRHFNRTESRFFCNLTDRHLSYSDIIINCKGYKPAMRGGVGVCC